jgi:hypothetical protein
MLNGMSGEIRSGMQVEISHQCSLVKLHGLDGDIQDGCDLFAGSPLGHQLRHFALPGREPIGEVAVW